MKYFIDFILNKNCDLNCEYCTSRASICGNEVYDFEQFKKDFKHFADLGIDFEAILIGGEPFCNKDIFKYVDYINSLNKNITVNIFTNGLYLSKAKEKVWKKLSESKCNLWMTIYSCSEINYNELINKCIKYNIKFSTSHYNYEKENAKNFRICNLRNKMRIHKFCESNSEEYKNKAKLRECIICYDQTLPICIRAFNGILYYGACFPMLKNVDKVFGSNLNEKLIENEDFIKIENVKDPIDITSVKFCKNHCRFLGEAPWKKSKKERIEFFVEE